MRLPARALTILWWKLRLCFYERLAAFNVLAEGRERNEGLELPDVRPRALAAVLQRD